MDKITHAELVEMFGDEMPLDAVMLITNAPGSMTADDLRAKLREIASQPPVSDDLVGQIGQLAQDHMEQHHGVCLKASEWDALARAIIPIVRADEREACARIAEMHDHRGDIATAIRERTSHE